MFEWTYDKQRSIDWNNVGEVVAHRFLFITLVDFHPKLAALVADDAAAFRDEKRKYEEDPAAAVASMQARGLFTLLPGGATRWCHGCRNSGHTLSACPARTISQKTSSSSSSSSVVATNSQAAAAAATGGGVFHRFRQHCRAAQVEEKTTSSAAGQQSLLAAGDGGGNSSAGRPFHHQQQQQQMHSGPVIPGWGQKFGGSGWAPHTLSVHIGRIRDIELHYNMANIEAGYNQPIPAMLTRARFGLRKPCEGESVTFRIERSGDRLRAVDIMLDRTAFINADIEHMLNECGFGSAAASATAGRTATGAGAISGAGAKDPISLLRFILQNHDDWANMLRFVLNSAPELQSKFAYAIACNVASRDNLFPIHNAIMKLVCRLMCVKTGGAPSPSSSHPGAAAAAAQRNSAGDDAAASLAPTNGALQPVAFVPDLVVAAIPAGTADQMDADVGQSLYKAVELADTLRQIARFLFVLRINDFRSPPECTTKLRAAIAALSTHYKTFPRQQQQQQQQPDVVEARLQMARDWLAAASAEPAPTVEGSSSAAVMQLAVQSPLPSAKEIVNARDFFHSDKLPVLTHECTQFSTQQQLVSAHLTLLRADVCEATARTTNAAFFAPPGGVSEQTQQDLMMLRTYSNVRFVGRTCSRFFDSCNAALIQFSEDGRPPAEDDEEAEDENENNSATDDANKKKKKKRLRPSDSSPFDAGRVFFLITNENPATITDDDMFWLVVQTPESSPLHRNNIVAVSPVARHHVIRNAGSESGAGAAGFLSQEEQLGRLQRALDRNQANGTAIFANRMMETNLFLFGYEPVFRALSSFLIPTCPVALPMPEELFGSAPASSTKGGSNGSFSPTVVPPHYRDGFKRIVDGIRGRNRLDAGQDAAMRALLTRRLITVWGSPGTGKSFTGCRIVEAYVRYKHALRNGQMLRDVDPLLLPSTSTADLQPKMGPIVVITYKNHALDEFLLDLKRSGLWGSAATGTADSFSRNSVVRVGSNSQEPELREVNLAHLVDLAPSVEKSSSYFRMVNYIKQAEAIAAAIRAFEEGKVRPVQFEKWLTPEQRERFFSAANSGTAARWDERSAESDIAAFLRGDRFVGKPQQAAVTRTFFERVRSHVDVNKKQAAAQTQQLLLSTDEEANNNNNNSGGADNNNNNRSMFAALTGGATVTTEAQAEEGPEFKSKQQDLDGDNNNNSSNKAAAEDELVGGDSMRDSTLQAIKKELASEKKKRFVLPDAGLASLVSAEAMARGSSITNDNANNSNNNNGVNGGFTPIDPIWATLQSLWSLSPQQRHDFMAAHVEREIALLARQYEVVSRSLELATNMHQHLKSTVKVDVLRTADVVGITTTGCAIFQDLLRSIEPQVIVVEEAAEVLESQLLACLPESLKQIVLIGDHFQLQPSTETYEYEKKNKMNISLFERLVQSNGTSKNRAIQLVEQRRMRPEICDMIRPFYVMEEIKKQKLQKQLGSTTDGGSEGDDSSALVAVPAPGGEDAGAVVIEDHASVHTRLFVDRLGRTVKDHVPGLVKNVFFWSHTVPEQEANVGLSIINMREIELTLMLVQHLLTQKLHPTSITIITPYLGQRRAMGAALEDAGVEKGVRVCTVDRFQGDEADVIILSLVRTAKMTDFLKYRNRLIVAASRARFAMVFIGSEQLLLQSPHWKQVLDQLRARGCVGDALPVSFGLGSSLTTAQVKSSARSWPAAPAAVARD